MRLSETKEFKLLAQTQRLKHSDEETFESLQLHLSPLETAGKYSRLEMAAWLWY